MGKKIERELTPLDIFAKKAREEGVTYGQLQVRETCARMKKRGFSKKKHSFFSG